MPLWNALQNIVRENNQDRPKHNFDHDIIIYVELQLLTTTENNNELIGGRNNVYLIRI